MSAGGPRIGARALAAVLLLWLAPSLLPGPPWRWPERWNPWSPLDIAAAPNAFTRHKLARLDGDPAQCRAVLASAGFDQHPLADTSPAPGCGLRSAVRIARSTFAVSSPFALSCRAAVSLALWERHVVAPAAARHLRQPVRRLDHLGSYACRNVYGRDDAARSRHATADAVDVAGFTLDGGQRVTLARHWQDAATPQAAFLRELRDGACRYFDVVLGPDYNAAHRDHLHLDRGGGRLCR